MKMLETPKRLVDVVIDTDTYNEADDQFALAYLFASQERCNIKAVYAAPFLNERVATPAEGMEKSYEEILNVLRLMENEAFIPHVLKGSDTWLSDEHTPVNSAAAKDLAARAKGYSKENPLYVIAIAALTNVASAILMDPSITENIVVVWLGGKAHFFGDASEFNLNKDVLAARVVFETCQNRLVQIPCLGCASAFATTRWELEYWLNGKNALCDYLVKNILDFEKEKQMQPWSRPIWDVTAVAWLLNDDKQFMLDCLKPVPVITYDRMYSVVPDRGAMRYVYHIDRDALFQDLFEKLSDIRKMRYRAR